MTILLRKIPDKTRNSLLFSILLNCTYIYRYLHIIAANPNKLHKRHFWYERGITEGQLKAHKGADRA